MPFDAGAPTRLTPSLRSGLAAEAQNVGVHLLVLFGSRARHDAHAASDWDFAARADSAEQLSRLRVALSLRLESEQIDLVDLERASGLLRHGVATDGQVVYEDRPGLFGEFRLAAARFWCDVEPVLRQSHGDVLRSLTGE